MKIYIFITLNLCAMNGADMYIYNKKNYLEKQGYRVYVFSGVRGDIVINGLAQYRNLQSGYFRLYPGCFRRKVTERMLDWIVAQSGIADGDEVIVESSNIYSAMWAELLAQKLHCRHLFFILTEKLKMSAAEKAFCRFKLGRHEFAGIAKESVQSLLEDNTIPYDETMRVRAYCTNTIDECQDIVSPQLMPDATTTIGSIGRLDKPYVMPLMTELNGIFSRNPQNRYNLVMIGGARSEKQMNRLKAVIAGNSNVNCVFTGPLFPIPQEFVRNCDFFISAAGSASATYKKGAATIRLNPNTGGIVGITGLTYRYDELGMFDEQYPLTELEHMMQTLMEKKSEIVYMSDDEFEKMTAEMEAEFDRQLRFVDLDNRYEYYDTCKIKHEKKNYRIFNVMGKVMNGDSIERMMELMRRLFK